MRKNLRGRVKRRPPMSFKNLFSITLLFNSNNNVKCNKLKKVEDHGESFKSIFHPTWKTWSAKTWPELPPMNTFKNRGLPRQYRQ
ncbi:hypothetical protein Leryth_011493 [Lithospermum erythrorhizon]|nr:hypothetical protein Leryth_011493 [Lithospermum erythrorhizon]